MSLRAKFGVLLSILALIVLLALGVAGWSLTIMEREVRSPFRTLSSTLVSLGEAKASLEKQGRMLLGVSASGVNTAMPRPEDAQEPGEAAGLAAQIDRNLAEVESADWVLSQTGKTTFANLKHRAAEWRRTAADLAAGRDGPAEAQQQFRELHDLIERVELRLVRETGAALEHGAQVRGRLLIVLGAAFLAAALSCGLGYTLVRRWVLRPVADLRAAAARIGAGDFEHRLPVDETRARDELERLSVEINHMAGLVKQMQDERVDRERLAAVGEMVRRLAHNLRNPLGGIRGLAELSRSESRHMGPQARDIADAQDRIIQAVDRFEKWLSDLLNVTRPAAVRPEPLDVRAWLEGLVEAHRPMAMTRGGGIRLVLDVGASPHRATVDVRHLEHAISAILSNAIEATASVPPGTEPGRVRIVSRLVQPASSGGVWEIRVEDQGPGVPHDLRQQIFKPYFTTKKDGNGIGLAQALQVVRAHGGGIRVETPPVGLEASAAGTGAVFVVQIPLASGTAGQEEPQELARIGQ